MLVCEYQIKQAQKSVTGDRGYELVTKQWNKGIGNVLRNGERRPKDAASTVRQRKWNDIFKYLK